MTVKVCEVRAKKEQNEFLRFPLDLYKDNPYFVPPLWMDEKKIFTKNYVYYDSCDAVYYNAYDENGVMVGRISGILQKASNEKNGEKRVRFTRFDAINDVEVARALFTAVENWAREKGMDTVCGPLGFSDLEREGLLIEGFDQLSTFEEQYNAAYYPALIEACGYAKEVDWLESKLYLPEDEDGTMGRLAANVLERNGLHVGKKKNIRAFLKDYGDGIFALLDETYAHLYGTVPFTEGMKKMTLDNFRLLVDVRNVMVILDEKDNIVCFGVCLPSLAKALQKSKGHLTPAALLRVLKAIRKPKVIDLALVGIAPAYLNKGITAVVISELYRMMREGNIEYAETNLNLEDNYAIRNCWKRFREVQHKRRRSYVKSLEVKE